MAKISFDEADVTRRAMAAYFRSAHPAHTPHYCEMELHKRKHYVVLRGHVNETIAVYRIRNDAMLKRLRRWPKELTIPMTRGTSEESTRQNRRSRLAVIVPA